MEASVKGIYHHDVDETSRTSNPFELLSNLQRPTNPGCVEEKKSQCDFDSLVHCIDQSWNFGNAFGAETILQLEVSAARQERLPLGPLQDSTRASGQLGTLTDHLESSDIDDTESLDCDLHVRSRFSSWTTSDDTAPLLPLVKHQLKASTTSRSAIRIAARRRASAPSTFDSQPSNRDTYPLLHAFHSMSASLHFNMVNLETSFLRNRDIGENLHSRLSRGLIDACENWGHYLEASSSGELVPWDLIDDFLATKFLFWLEVLSLTGGVERAIPMLHSLARRELRNGLGSWMQCFLTSAIEFIDEYAECMNSSTPHIYASCFLFPPPPHQLNLFFNHYASQINTAGVVDDPIDIRYDNSNERYSIIRRWSRVSTVSTSSAQEVGRVVVKMNTTGWILGPSRELLLWVPERHRADLRGEGKRRDGRFAVEQEEDSKIVHVDVSRLSAGSEWLTCMSGIEAEPRRGSM